MKHPLVRWLVWIFGGLVALTAVAAGVMFFLVSRLDIRAEIETAVEEATGRDLTIAGNVGVTFFPVLGLQAKEATLANVEGGRAPAFASIGELDVGVEIFPLLRREVVVSNLVLGQPKLNLEIDAEGVPNWIFEPVQAPEGAPSPTPSAPATETPPFSLRMLRIVDGEASFFDARVNSSWSVSEANLRTSIDSLDAPVRVRGSVVYNIELVGLDIEVAAPRAVIAGDGTALTASVRSALVEAEFDGAASPSTGQISGQITASGTSLRRLAGWLGAPIEGGYGMEAYRVAGNLTAGAERLGFTNAEFWLDALHGRGDFELMELRGKPYVSGRLEMFEADFNPYIFGEAPEAAPAAAGIASPASAPEAAPASEPERAVDVREAPSEEAIDFSGLQAFNCDLELVTHVMRIQQMSLDAAHLGLVINDGFLVVTLHRLQMYGGEGRGRLELDAREANVRLSQELTVDGVNAQRFLSDAANFSSIEGRAELSLSLRASGRSQSELTGSADGRAHIEVVAGALRGVDLGGISRTISNALSGDLISANARTPFSGFSATFALSDGVLGSDSLSFNTPDLSIRGIGVFDLNSQRMDVRLAPRSPRGGIVIPFSARGPFAQLAFNSDVRGQAQREILANVRSVQTASRASQ